MRVLLASLSVALFAVTHAAAVEGNSPRHVVVTVIDDLGFDDFGFMNEGQINTPVFNDLKTRGVHFDQYYVQPSCSPTRATILTGRKPVHTGINFWIPNAAYGLPLNETTLAQVLNKRGYKSHAVGKWHLGLHKTAYLPTFRGFDSFYGYYEGSEDYWSHNFYGHGLDFHQEDAPYCGQHNCSKLLWDAVGVADQPNYWDAYSTNLFTRRAVDIIGKHADPQSVGLFIYLAYQGVHEPRQSPEHYYDVYNVSIKDQHRREFAGMLSALDEGMGNVSTALRSAKMYADTLFIVTTDNGGPTTECSTTGQSNWPFRGSKCSIWEGGTHGAGFMFWEGLPAAVQGLEYQGLIHAADLLPTIVSAVTGAHVAPGETLPLDGIDMWGALLSNGASPRQTVYYGISQSGKGPAVRDAAGYKIIMGDGGGGKGEWSLEQLPNKSSSSSSHDYDLDYALVGGPTCSPQHGTCYPGHDMTSLNSSGYADCCAKCHAHKGCAGYTYRQNAPPHPQCFLKSGIQSGAKGPCVSGYMPGHNPEPNGPGPLLYHVLSDLGERTPLDITDAKNAAIVVRLQAVIAKYALTKVPQASSDPSCPPFSGLNSSKGLYIGPWCD